MSKSSEYIIGTAIKLIMVCMFMCGIIYVVETPQREWQKMNEETIERATIDCAMKCVDLDMYYSDSTYKNQVDKIIMQYNVKGSNVTLKDVICKGV